MDPQLIEKITKLVIAKLEQEPKKENPLSVQELQEWERISATFQVGKVSTSKKRRIVGLTEEELEKWDQVTATIQESTKRKENSYSTVATFHPYN